VRTRIITVTATLAACLVAVTGCSSKAAQTQPSSGDKVIDSAKYIALYQKTIAHFPEPMPNGITFPSDPPAMQGQIGIGNAAGMAYFYWNCSWEDVYLNGTDQTLKAKALTQMKKFPNTSWGSKYYDDSSGIWVDVVKKASLGDLSELQQFYDSDCSYYRQVNHK